LGTPFQANSKFPATDAGSSQPRSPPSDRIKYFKQEWKKLNTRLETIEDPHRYHTNPARWCPYFVNSRFLICKHLLFFHEPIKESDRVRFFREIRRQRSPPFWVDDRLTIKPEYRPSEGLQQRPGLSPEASNDSHAEENKEDTIDPETINDWDNLQGISDSKEGIIEPSANLDNSESDSGNNIRRFVSDVQKFAELVKDQDAKGNYKFLEKLIDSPMGRGVETLMEDEASLRCRRTMRRTWDSKRKNKLSMWL
jgi:hypothetical protein